MRLNSSLWGSFARPSMSVMASFAALATTSPAMGQVQIGYDSGITPNTVCLTGVYLTVGNNSDDCLTASSQVPWVQIGSDTKYVFFDGSSGESTFNAPAYFNDPVKFTDTVSFSGANVTFATPTTFTFASTF